MKFPNQDYFEQWKHTADIWLTIGPADKVRWVKNRNLECKIVSIYYEKFADSRSTLMYNVLLDDGRSYRATPMKIPEAELEVLA